MLITSGCSGSSFVVTMLRRILAAHGYAVAREKSEIYKSRKNRMYEQAKELAPAGASESDIVINATAMLNQELFQRGEILMFKWKPHMFEKFADRVGRENVLYGAMFRENALDQLVCAVRDCFNNEVGYPVLNGSRTDLCFSRRTAGEGGRTKAHFPPERLGAAVAYVRHEAQKVAGHKERFGAATYEELSAFEYAGDAVAAAASVDAWCVLTGRLLGGAVDRARVEEVLRPYAAARRTRHHEDVIDEPEEVFRALREAGLGHYIRTRDAKGEGTSLSLDGKREDDS